MNIIEVDTYSTNIRLRLNANITDLHESLLYSNMTSEYIEYLKTYKPDKLKELQDEFKELNNKMFDMYKVFQVTAFNSTNEFKIKLDKMFEIDLGYHARKTSEKFGL